MSKSYLFRSIPPDVYKIILKEQNRIKEKKGTTQFSIELTIYHIIREYEKRINPLAENQGTTV